ncbi:hypothetical protein M407DRAFT_31237 [Tulasnella calospora MUT 4182]|uniref:Uncharacterized protein n=1 Tax=Tulasnella calospora MUT 4182 TaxID=1051891 RepID=A0A0C3PVV8_9AGAM|nr:hypothetical protein M407DRAFT_31237 [Tulasnella calospora MUT 4182]
MTAVQTVQSQPSSESQDRNSLDLRTYQPDLSGSRTTTWLADTSVRSNESSEDNTESVNKSSGTSGITNISSSGEEEAQPIWYDLTATTALILGAPGRVDGKTVREFNPATQRVDLWGIGDGERLVDIVDNCLGPHANRYFNLHYYSQGSKAIILQAYCYHHQYVDQFVKHLIRRGVLPMLGVYIWELLKTSFNWKLALKADIGKRVLGSGTSRLIDMESLDFGACSECQDQGTLLLRLQTEHVPADRKGKGTEVE